VSRTRAAAVLCMAVAALLPACGAQPDDEALPDVEITPLGGGAAVSLQSFDGPAVVNLWATWCPPCLREIPDFEAEHRARGDALTFVGINIGEGADQASAFLADLDVSYGQYLDPTGVVAAGLATRTMPVTVVIDADGRITTVHEGEISRAQLASAIDRALGD
jgi:cytochrome c biogenesis protein CcmG/thiol:disulfide interchange protein DsbE